MKLIRRHIVKSWLHGKFQATMQAQKEHFCWNCNWWVDQHLKNNNTFIYLIYFVFFKNQRSISFVITIVQYASNLLQLHFWAKVNLAKTAKITKMIFIFSGRSFTTYWARRIYLPNISWLLLTRHKWIFCIYDWNVITWWEISETNYECKIRVVFVHPLCWQIADSLNNPKGKIMMICLKIQICLCEFIHLIAMSTESVKLTKQNSIEKIKCV